MALSQKMLRSLAIPPDTTPEAAWVQMRIYRRMPMKDRLRQAFGMFSFMREVVSAGVRTQHPEYSEERVRYEVIRRTLGAELFAKAYPEVDMR